MLTCAELRDRNCRPDADLWCLGTAWCGGEGAGRVGEGLGDGQGGGLVYRAACTFAVDFWAWWYAGEKSRQAPDRTWKGRGRWSRGARVKRSREDPSTQPTSAKNGWLIQMARHSCLEHWDTVLSDVWPLVSGRLGFLFGIVELRCQCRVTDGGVGGETGGWGGGGWGG